MKKQDKPLLNLWERYKEGEFIDAKDNQGEWKVGYIIAKNQPSKTFKIRFDGWSSYYDQFLSYNTSRLKPFRSIVLGYTGPQESPAKRQGWKYTRNYLQYRIQKSKNLLKKYWSKTVHYVNQSLRGYNLILCDFLMTQKFDDEADMTAVIKYLDLNVAILAEFLKIINQNFDEYFEVIIIDKDPEHTNTTEAIFMSYYQIFDTICTIWGCYDRSKDFFDYNKGLIKQFFNKPLYDAKDLLQNRFTDQLQKHQGYDLIDQIIEQLQSTRKPIPLLFLSSFTNLLTAVYTVFKPQIKESMITQLNKISQKSFDSLSSNETKELRKYHEVSNFFDSVGKLSSKTSIQELTLNQRIHTELQICLDMIIDDNFERKLGGIGYLIRICEQHDRILKDGWFVHWADDVGLFGILFTANNNQQIAKKACQLVKSIYNWGIKENDIDVIIASRRGKDQNVVNQIYNLIVAFGCQLKQKQKLKLFDKVSDVRSNQWDQHYINMIRRLTESCYGQNVNQKLLHPFGFAIVYEYAEIVQSEFALSELLLLLKKVWKSSIYPQFQKQCFESIASDNKPWIHIKILLMIWQNKIDKFKDVNVPLINILVTTILNHAQDLQSKVVENGLKLLSSVAESIQYQVEIQNFELLWPTLTNSAHRQVFFKWLVEKDENGRFALSHCLTTFNSIRLLYILWQKDEDRQRVDQDQAIFIIQLFKTVNIKQDKMTRTNHLIQPIRFELIKFQKIWQTFKVTHDERASQLIADLLAEIYTSYQKYDLQLSISNLISYDLASQIRGLIQNQNSTYLKRLLSLTEKAILREQEVFTITTIPRGKDMQEYTVLQIDTDRKKVISFNSMQNFYQFKKLVSQSFNIPLYKLIVYNTQRNPILLQQYDKNMGQIFAASDKIFISQNTNYESLVKKDLNKNLELFFQLLDDGNLKDHIWNIIQRLPVPNQLRDEIAQTQNIIQKINQEGFYKELYFLKVLAELPEEWWLQFTNSGNLDHFMNNFVKVKFETHIDFKYLYTLSQIIEKMLEIKREKQLNIQIPVFLPIRVLDMLTNLLSSIDSYGSKNAETELDIITILFSILKTMENQGQISICYQIIAYPNCEQLLTLGLIQIPHFAIRKRFYENLKSVITQVKAQDRKKYLDLLFAKMLHSVTIIQNGLQVKEYFLFASYFLSLVPPAQAIQYNGKNTLCYIFDLILGQAPEVSAQTPNFFLCGLLSILKYFLSGEDLDSLERLARFIVQTCLLAQDQNLCKSKLSRNECFNLLKVVINLHEKIFKKVIKYFFGLHKTASWRTRRSQDWQIIVSDKARSSAGYVGIKNLGCICYMNSLMQQLFMILEFRSGIIDCQDARYPQNNLLYQFQKMFYNLWLSQKKFYDPSDLCFEIKDTNNQPTNVTVQMDIHEFSIIFFDQLEKQLIPTNYPNLIKETFEGVLSNEIVCKGCPHFSNREQNFLSISLTVKNKKDIHESFETMIKGNTLDGDNAYFCQRCNKKVSAVSRVSLKKLPDHLILTLKRFEFDHQTMVKRKLNQYYQFPINLDLMKYSHQYLRKKENPNAIQDEDKFSDEYFKYILKGVVIHSGQSESGHYYSYIQDRNTLKWFEFNDTIVRNFNIDDLANQAFGGYTGYHGNIQKTKNAYMLIYERQEKLGIEKKIILKQEDIDMEAAKPSILKQVLDQNKLLKVQSLLFSQQYSTFVYSLLDDLNNLSPKQQKTILKYAITVYLTTTVRDKSEIGTQQFLKKINSCLQNQNDLKEWVIDLFSQPKILDQFFKNGLTQAKKLIAYWVAECYLCSNDLAKQYFCNLILNKLVQQNENRLEYCLILYETSRRCSDTLNYMAKNGVVGRFIENIIAKQKRKFVGPLKIVPQSSQIGNETVLTDNQAKKTKQDNQNGYVWALINLITTKAAQLQLPLGQYISQLEQIYLYLPETKIFKILVEMKTKFQIHEFINLLCYLSINNKEFIAILSRLVVKGVKNCQSSKYRQFFILFQKMFSIQDEFANLRVLTIGDLMQAITKNQRYSVDYNVLQQWAIILINRNELLRISIQYDQELLNSLMAATGKKIPINQIASKNKFFSDSMINKFHGVKYPCSNKEYIQLTRQMAAFYQQLINDNFAISQVWPSTPQILYLDFKTGDLVTYFDPKEKLCYQGKIADIFMNRLELHLASSQVIYVWRDDDNLSLRVKFMSEAQQEKIQSSNNVQIEADEADEADQTDQRDEADQTDQTGEADEADQTDLELSET